MTSIGNRLMIILLSFSPINFFYFIFLFLLLLSFLYREMIDVFVSQRDRAKVQNHEQNRFCLFIAFYIFLDRYSFFLRLLRLMFWKAVNIYAIQKSTEITYLLINTMVSSEYYVCVIWFFFLFLTAREPNKIGY